MTGRELVFSNPLVIRAVNESFVPVAENVSELQTSEDEKGRFFRGIAVQGRMKGRSRPGVSHQGIYAFTADGVTLSSGNPLESEKTLALLREALANWELQPARAGDAPFVPPEASQQAGYPEDGAVLRMTVRDLPRGDLDGFADGEERFAMTWNNDFVWLDRRDVRALLPSLLEVGSAREVPQALTRRIARFHLRDIVRGEPRAWGPGAVQHIRLIVEVVDRDGSSVKLRYNGHAVLREHVDFRDAHEPIEWSFDNTLDVAIAGEAVWEIDAVAFTRFDLLATGQRAGAHRYNVRTRDPGPAPIGFSFELAGDSAWERTPPHEMSSYRTVDDEGVFPMTRTGEPYFGDR